MLEIAFLPELSFIHFQVRSAFRRADTPAPVQDLSDKVLHRKKEYMERESFPGEFALSPTRGRIYDKKPFPIHLEAGRQYSWCTCGHSKSQVLTQTFEYYHNRSDDVLLVVSVVFLRYPKYLLISSCALARYSNVDKNMSITQL